MDKKIIQKAGKYFTETEKHQIIQELLEHQLTKKEPVNYNTQSTSGTSAA